MNILKLKEFNNEHIVYLYQPEGTGGYGEIAYVFADKEVKILKRAEESSSWYANHALKKIKECVKDNNLPIEIINAWY